ncbi:MAG: acyltransferase [Gammaproteobacteria bacterium]|nr:acyltransferase [Gammaproteobacteria bacterium]
MINMVFDILSKLKEVVERKREIRKMDWLQDRGMHIGKDVFIPISTWIDASHCYLISVGDRCRFGPNCVLLAHDATMNELLDAGKIGKITIHESCSIGFGTIILPGVEIGPNVIIGAYSVISTNIPPGSIVTGNPAKVVGKIKDFERYHRMLMKKQPLFPYDKYGSHTLPEQRRKEIMDSLGENPNSCGYITGGYTAMKDSGEFYSGRNK